MEEKVVRELSSIVGTNWVATEIDRIRDYLLDQTLEPVRPEPNINSILRYANENYIAVEQSIILPLERLNKILEVDKDNLFGRNQGKNLQRGD